MNNAEKKFNALFDPKSIAFIGATEIPFAVGEMEERIFYMLGQKGIAMYRTPETAAKVLSHLVAYGKYLSR